MKRNPVVVAACTGLAILAVIVAFLFARTDEQRLADINHTIDAFHQAAADADLDAYFDLMTEDARFLGTDASERWPRREFYAYCLDRGAFDEAPAWVYTPSQRHIDIAGDVAWFDELLTHDRYGSLRGSGVLTLVGGEWKIAQYNLTFLVPNEAAPSVVEAIKASDPPLPEGEGTGEREEPNAPR